MFFPQNLPVVFCNFGFYDGRVEILISIQKNG